MGVIAVDLLENVKSFLLDADFSNYAISAFLALLQNYEQDAQTAKDLSNASNVPIGRIYEVLEELKIAGLIEVLESNPKRYRMIPLNQALSNLITATKKASQRKTEFLFERAKEIEKEMLKVDKYLSRDKSQVFLRTLFGTGDMYKFYVELFKGAEKEILLSAFLNENTPRIIRNGRLFYDPLKMAADRGVRVRQLWCLDYDTRPLSVAEKKANAELFGKIIDILRTDLNIPVNHPCIENRFIPQSIPSYFDVIDQNRVLFKLRNPLQPFEVFGCVCLLDPILALELRKRFNSMWLFGDTNVE
jgi:sugar-specific transcriptional regulator TrmB